MSLFHYAAWNGSRIMKTKLIVPSNQYQRFTGRCLVTEWPALVFLTRNKYWEPSVQAYNHDGHKEKCGSCPVVYTELGIPCWKFQVTAPRADDFLVNELWERMIDDAIQLGSDPTEWAISSDFVRVTKAWRWNDGRWKRSDGCNTEVNERAPSNGTSRRSTAESD